MKSRNIIHWWKIARLRAIALGMLVLVSAASAFGAGVPVRLSFKFILNASNNRPPTGAINTDAEVNAQVQRANQILSALISELRMENLEIMDVPGISQWYGATTASRDALRTAAMAAPATYHWRNDAVNVYISGGDDSAIADFPPNNNIILLCQGSHATTVAHEVGHILSLYHTHDGDGCSDTMMDNSAWTQDDIALNNFGYPYSSLLSSQQDAVDLVWWNVMSYHNVDDRYRLSSCQMDRESTQGFTDRSRLLSRAPVYVDAAYGGSAIGTFTQPYQTIQQAINAGALSSKVMVLKQGDHPRPVSVLNTAVDLVTRKGGSTIEEAPPSFSLPYAVEESGKKAVREAVVRAQISDRRGDIDGVIANLQEAEKEAAGREKTVIQLELAQRFRDSRRHREAASYFRKTAQGADQEELRKHALKKADAMDEAQRAEAQKPGTSPAGNR